MSDENAIRAIGGRRRILEVQTRAGLEAGDLTLEGKIAQVIASALLSQGDERSRIKLGRGIANVEQELDRRGVQCGAAKAREAVCRELLRMRAFEMMSTMWGSGAPKKSIEECSSLGLLIKKSGSAERRAQPGFLPRLWGDSGHFRKTAAMARRLRQEGVSLIDESGRGPLQAMLETWGERMRRVAENHESTSAAAAARQIAQELLALGEIPTPRMLVQALRSGEGLIVELLSEKVTRLEEPELQEIQIIERQSPNASIRERARAIRERAELEGVGRESSEQAELQKAKGARL